MNTRNDAGRVISPPVNILENEREIVVEAEMSGLGKEDIDIQIEGDELTMVGRVPKAAWELPQGYEIIHAERCPYEYRRTFLLGEDVDRNAVSARYENGVLILTIAKSQEAQPKKIQVS